jgi:hypothetical protein
MSWIIEGVEYIDGTFGPRCVMPISGVVVMVISSEIPGTNSGFTGGSFPRPAANAGGTLPGPMVAHGSLSVVTLASRRLFPVRRVGMRSLGRFD